MQVNSRNIGTRSVEGFGIRTGMQDTSEEHESTGSGSVSVAMLPLTPPSIGSNSISTSCLPTTASAFARISADEWNIVAEQNRCKLGSQAVDVVRLNEFKDHIKYPSCVKENEFVDWVALHENSMWTRLGQSESDISIYRLWVSLNPDLYYQDDPYELTSWRHTLFSFWDSYVTADHLKNSEQSIHEKGTHGGIDNLIQLAFETRFEAGHICCAEQPMALPASPFLTTADVATTMKPPDAWIRLLDFFDNSHVFATTGSKPTLVTTFICEYKTADFTAASRQLALGLSSAQHQRRALGFDDGELYGAIVIGAELVVYVSSWVGEVVHVNPTDITLELRRFDQFLACYLFLCKLSDVAAEQVKENLRKLESEATIGIVTERCMKASQSPWRRETYPNGEQQMSGVLEGGGGVVGEDVSTGTGEMEEWQLLGCNFATQCAVCSPQDECPAPPCRDLLIEENIRANEESYTKHGVGEGTERCTPPGSDITEWARQVIVGQK